MINSIEIKNFQSHKKTKLEFDKGVNVIIGPSDCGKTAILRALNWVVYNRPLGDSFRRHDTDKTEVSLYVDNHVITRGKTKTENYYTVDGQVLSAIKTEVPDEVKEILNIGDINIQKQLDRPFLLDASAGEVASHFNQVAHLDKIDLSNTSIQSWVRAITQEIKTGKANILELEEQSKKYQYLDQYEQVLQSVEHLESERTLTLKSSVDIALLKKQVTDVDIEIERHSFVLGATTSLNLVAELMRKREVTDTARGNLLLVKKTIQEKDEQLKKQKELIEISPILEDLEKLQQEQKIKTEDFSNLSKFINNYKKVSNDLNKTEQQYQALSKKLHDCFPDICPLCGAKQVKK